MTDLWVIVAQKDKDRLSDSLSFHLFDEVSDSFVLALSNRDHDLLLVFSSCLEPLRGVELLDSRRWKTESHQEDLPEVGTERCAETDHSLVSEIGQTGESRPVQAQQVVLNHLLCLVDDEYLVVIVSAPSTRVPDVGNEYSPGQREHRRLLLNLVSHNRLRDVDDDFVTLGALQFKTTRCKQQECERFACCWWCDSTRYAVGVCHAPRRNQNLGRIRPVILMLFSNFVAQSCDSCVLVLEVLILFHYLCKYFFFHIVVDGYFCPLCTVHCRLLEQVLETFTLVQKPEKRYIHDICPVQDLHELCWRQQGRFRSFRQDVSLKLQDVNDRGALLFDRFCCSNDQCIYVFLCCAAFFNEVRDYFHLRLS